MNDMLNRYGSLAVFLSLAVLATVAGAAFEAGNWYYHVLTKPEWTLPAWLLAVAWAVVYVFAALAAWVAWSSESRDRARALTWWVAVLAINVLYYWLYFDLERPGWAALAIGLGLAATLACTRSFRRISGQAAGLMVPVLLWLAYLWAHTFASWTLSGGLFSRFIT